MNPGPFESVLSRHWRPLALVVLFSLCFNVLMLTAPLYMLSIFSHVLTSKNPDTLWLLTIVALLALALQAVVDTFRSRLLVRVGLAIDAAIGPRVVESVVARGADASPADPKALADSADLRRFMTDINLMALIDLPFVPLYLIVIAWLHPVLGVVALAGASIHLLIAWLGDWWVRSPLDEASAARRRGQGLTEEVLRNADVVRAMGMMPALSARLRQSGRESLLWLQRGADRAAGLRALVRGLRIALQLGLYCAGAWLFLNDQVMVGAIVAASVLLNRAMSPLDAAIPASRAFRLARAAARRLHAVLTEPEAEPDIGGGNDFGPRPRFEARRVSVRAPDTGRMVLNRISLALQPGELLGVVGACGSGKSALGRLLAGAWGPVGGSVAMDGRSFRDWSPRQRASQVGYCPQELQLFAGAIDQNIARFDPGEGLRDAVMRVSRAVGLDSMVSALPDAYGSRLGPGGLSLPSGMRQQLALARAFFGNPGLVVLDEPAAWLDRSGQQALLEAIDAVRSRGATVVVISHQPALLRNADRIAVMNGGVIEVIGPAQKVLAQLSGRQSAGRGGIGTNPSVVSAAGSPPIAPIASGAL